MYSLKTELIPKPTQSAKAAMLKQTKHNEEIRSDGDGDGDGAGDGKGDNATLTYQHSLFVLSLAAKYEFFSKILAWSALGAQILWNLVRQVFE